VDITETTTVDAPLERVWQLTLDIEALPSVTPTISGVERLDAGPVQVGSRARVAQPGLPARIWTVDEIDAPHRFVWSTRLLGVRMVGVHELATAGEDRCQLTLTIRFEGRGSGLVGRLGRRSISRALAAEADGFARAAVPASR
jgi:ligand-binding SRPBCC domain-containing protein